MDLKAMKMLFWLVGVAEISPDLQNRLTEFWTHFSFRFQMGGNHLKNFSIF